MSSKRSNLNNYSIDSAALQADIARRLNLPGANPGLKRTSSKKNITRKEMKSDSSIIICDSCGFECSNKHLCSNCGYFLPSFNSEPKSLAQIRGLVSVPAKTESLSVSEWEQLESKIDCRGDAFCPICMEGFNKGHEVLLSCSHIFHRNCLQSFEKFVKLNERICPICRTSDYQKKITQKGSKAFENICAIKIQALWRGYIKRKNFYVIKKAFYKQGKGDEKGRKAFYQREFSLMNEKLSKDIDAQDQEIDTMITTSNQSLLESKQLDILFENMLRNRFEMQASQLPIINTNVNNQKFVSESDWNVCLKKALGRGLPEEDCAICMGKLTDSLDLKGRDDSLHSSSSSSSSSSHPNSTKLKRKVFLLSCSHAFHQNCISNFETYSLDEIPVCPVCRCTYKKRILSHDCKKFGDNLITERRIDY